jgi:hypothetical protein
MLAEFSNVLVSIASVGIMVALPILLPPMLRRFHIAADSDLARQLQAGLQAGAGLAYQYASTTQGGLASPNVQAHAVATGAAFVQRHMPEVLDHMQIGQPALVDMVNAQLGTLLAHDPTVTAGTPSTMPTPSAVAAQIPGVVVANFGVKGPPV